MSEVLAKMIALLSDADKKVFEQLSEKLKQVNGDLAKLTGEELNLIKQMEAKYGDKINQTNQQFQQNSELDLLEFPFAQYVRQVLARDLGDEFPQEEDAVAFAFNNKWLPLECQNENLVEELFSRFEDDITEINQWRNAMVEVRSDKRMAVGLSWFMVIFQLNQRFNG